MKLMMGGINGNHLRNITENAASDTQEVLAAVAYALDTVLLFDWCWSNSIPLKFYGRLDEGVAVSTSILATFLNRRSVRFQCRLVQHQRTCQGNRRIDASDPKPPFAKLVKPLADNPRRTAILW